MTNRLDSYVLSFDRCNLKCLFCMKDDDIIKNSKFTYNVAAQEIMFAKDEGYKCVDFYGGEPTCFSFLNEADRKSTRLNSSHIPLSRMPSSA